MNENKQNDLNAFDLRKLYLVFLSIFTNKNLYL